jgi:hypothetical protein
MAGNSFVLAPSVQELAKQGLTKVPEQYLLLNQDHVLVSNTQQLPIIDLGKLLCEDAHELEKLDKTCREWGFFQVLVYHFLISNLFFIEKPKTNFLR